MPDLKQVLRELYDQGLHLFMGAWLVMGLVLVFFSRRLLGKTDDLLVEAFGFFLDITLFGIALTLYNTLTERKRRIREYHDQLADFHDWPDIEGVARKAGIIKRLNEMGAALPSLQWIELRGAKLSKAILEGASLNDANLRGAHLGEAHLEGADLRAARLEGAQLYFANLRGAHLWGAHLEGAYLVWAHLEGANLYSAYLEGAHLEYSHLEGANLKYANLEGAYLDWAHLEGAKLFRAHLEGADLSSAKGLTREQIEFAFTDQNTKLPDYLDLDEGT